MVGRSVEGPVNLPEGLLAFKCSEAFAYIVIVVDGGLFATEESSRFHLLLHSLAVDAVAAAVEAADALPTTRKQRTTCIKPGRIIFPGEANGDSEEEEAEDEPPKWQRCQADQLATITRGKEKVRN